MMQNDDNDNNDSPVGSPPEGLGHDPLEWLQDDEDQDDEDIESSEASVPSEEEPQVVAEQPTAMSETPDEAELATPVIEEPTTDSSSTSAPAASTDNENQSLTIDNHKATIVLPEKLSVQIVEPLHTEWKTLFYDLPQSLEIDAGAVKDVDAAGMQLLYVLVQQMSYKGCDVVVLNVHHNLQRFFKVAGLNDFFSQYVHAA